MPDVIPVHWLSKDARYRIIDLMLSTRTATSLAEELGISRGAIRKYINRETHPSDNIMIKVFQIIAPYEEDRVIKIVIDDLVEALRRLCESLDKREHKNYLLKKLREVIKELERK